MAGQTLTQTGLVTLPDTLYGDQWFVVKADAGDATDPHPGENHQAVATAPTNVVLDLSTLEELHPTGTIDWASLEASLRPASIDSTDWNLIWERFVDQVGTTGSSLIVALSDVVMTLAQAGDPTSNVAPLLADYIAEASGASPNITLASMTDIADNGGGLDLSLARTYSASFLNRNNPGPFGDGWTFTYGISAVTAASGNVYITSPAGAEFFTLLPDGRYAAQPGDSSMLVLSDGAYVLTDASGAVERFLPDALELSERM